VARIHGVLVAPAERLWVDYLTLTETGCYLQARSDVSALLDLKGAGLDRVVDSPMFKLHWATDLITTSSSKISFHVALKKDTSNSSMQDSGILQDIAMRATIRTSWQRGDRKVK
jgi:hypothetical protein